MWDARLQQIQDDAKRAAQEQFNAQMSIQQQAILSSREVEQQWNDCRNPPSLLGDLFKW